MIYEEDRTTTFSIDPRLTLLQERFCNRTDILNILSPWGKPFPVVVDGELQAALAAHLDRHAPPVTLPGRSSETKPQHGRFHLGAHTPAPDGTTQWLVIDFDGQGHASALEDARATALATYDRCVDLELPSYLERSRGGHGWHLWLFFERLPAAKAKALGFVLAPRDARLSSGGVADPETGRGIEVFPKITKPLRTGQLGHAIWLPWHWRVPMEGANAFYRRELDGELAIYVPESLSVIEESEVDRVLERYALPPCSMPATTTTSSSSEPSDIREWRKKALEHLPLQPIYGSWLTGKARTDGWLECRDPASSSGDTAPSASVADGSNPSVERGFFYSFLDGKGISVFDFLQRHGGALDHREALRRIADLTGVPLPGSRMPPPHSPASGQGGASRRPKPIIRVSNRQLVELVLDAWSAVHTWNHPPRVFRFLGHLAELWWDDQKLSIRRMSEIAVFGRLAEAADWIRIDAKGEPVNVSPSKDTAREMHAHPHPDIPRLEAIATAPIFDSEGELIMEKGYHSDSALWYEPQLEIEAVSSTPTQQEVERSRGLLEELLADFTFAESADRTHAFAAFLLPASRRMIPGPTPIHLIESPTPGTGKTLLAKLIGIVTTGREPPTTTFSRKEEEMRKKIMALLSQTPTVILVDNVNSSMRSSEIAAAVTSDVFSDRLLGSNTAQIELPNRALWLFTSNNPSPSPEIGRRAIQIRLNAKTARPWMRTGFRHPLPAWAIEHRAELNHAILTLLRHWIARGKPETSDVLGSFENWSRRMGGILSSVGLEHFLENREELDELAEEDRASWRDFLAGWSERYGDAWGEVVDLLGLATKHELLPVEKATKEHLGRLLRGARDQCLFGWRIERGRKTSDGRKAVVYRLVSTE